MHQEIPAVPMSPSPPIPLLKNKQFFALDGKDKSANVLPSINFAAVFIDHTIK